jgi:hypothetical protein
MAESNTINIRAEREEPKLDPLCCVCLEGANGLCAKHRSALSRELQREWMRRASGGDPPYELVRRIKRFIASERNARNATREKDKGIG